MYRQGNELNKYLENLKRHTLNCIKNDRDLWTVIAVNSHIKSEQEKIANIEEIIKPLETQQLQIQAYIALSFGSRVINWACWQPGWWIHNVYNSQGQRSEQYEKLKTVNESIHRISPIYMRYEYMDTCILGRNVEDTLRFRKVEDNIIEQDVFKNIRLSEENSLIVNGYYKQPNSKNAAMMFTNVSDKMLTDPYTHKTVIYFKIDDPNAVVTAYNMGYPCKLEPENGVYSFCIENAEYVFVTVDFPEAIAE